METAIPMHTKDSDCTGIKPWDPNAEVCDECTTCGVTHGVPCDGCAERGFHKIDCAFNDENPVNIAIAEKAAADRAAERTAENASGNKALSAQDFFFEQAGDR